MFKCSIAILSFKFTETITDTVRIYSTTTHQSQIVALAYSLYYHYFNKYIIPDELDKIIDIRLINKLTKEVQTALQIVSVNL